jgi:LPPG:FO 2-phospho-L-lactate transferase
MENRHSERDWAGLKVTALAGGIGAAKLLIGLAAVIDPEQITVIANTGDDIELQGLRVCPDLDTVMYTLAGVVDKERGWGIQDDSFECLKWLGRYGGAKWFHLGDRDLATHIRRTERLRAGASLTEVTAELARALGVKSRILPMTDSYTPTMVQTDEGRMHLQEYFVDRRCEPKVIGIGYEGIQESRPGQGVLEAISEADVVVICPSNPFISIGPILAVPGLRRAIASAGGSLIAVSPIVGGRAIKGPAADMMRNLGHEVSPVGVAQMYRDFVQIFVLDEKDASMAAVVQGMGINPVVTNTIMSTEQDKAGLAEAVLIAAAGGRGY